MMRFIKAFLFGITGLFIVITLFSLLIPANVKVVRVAVINNTSIEKVYQQVANFDNWKKWHPIFTVDSAKLYWHPSALVGKDSGCIFMHHGREVSIKLISSDPSSIKFLVQSQGEYDIENDIILKTIPLQQAVQVEWHAVNQLHWYPWDKFYAIFIDKITGPDYEAALNGLKNYIEKKQ
jgi:hypothetical protein